MASNEQINHPNPTSLQDCAKIVYDLRSTIRDLSPSTPEIVSLQNQSESLDGVFIFLRSLADDLTRQMIAKNRRPKDDSEYAVTNCPVPGKGEHYPPRPDGSGWAIVCMAATDYHVYWTWRRSLDRITTP